MSDKALIMGMLTISVVAIIVYEIFRVRRAKDYTHAISFNFDSMNPQVWILDTSVALEIPAIVDYLYGVIIVPLALIGELDKLKNSSDQKKSYAARTFSKCLDDLSKAGRLSEGVRYTSKHHLDNVSTLAEKNSVEESLFDFTNGAVEVKIQSHHEKLEVPLGKNDSAILGTAYAYVKQCMSKGVHPKELGNYVRLLTNDLNMRVIAREYHIPVGEVLYRSKEEVPEDYEYLVPFTFPEE